MTQTVETKFTFKERKITDAEGNELGKVKKQPAFTVALPQPTPEELVAILQVPDVTNDKGEVLVDKQKALIMDAIQSIIRDQAKSQLDDVIESFGMDDTKTISASDIDFDSLTLEYIANLPPAQRGARAISEEDWKGFFADYLQVMVAATGKPDVKIKNHLELFKKPTRIQSNKEALSILVDQLDIYIAASQNLDDTAECASRLRSKFVKWFEADSKYDPNAL